MDLYGPCLPALIDPGPDDLFLWSSAVKENVPGVAPISDDSSVDSLFFSRASESERGIWGNNNYDDDASNAHEGANLVPPNFNVNEGVQPAPNIIQAPEGAPCRTRGKAKEYPPAVWHRGADGKLERVTLSVICKEYNKLNRASAVGGGGACQSLLLEQARPKFFTY
jgi:hypothetical protein